MKAKSLCALTLVLMACMPISQAAGSLTARSASMQVSLRIVDSCEIQASAHDANAHVSCSYGTPFMVQAAAPSRTDTAAGDGNSPAVVTVSF